MPEAKSADTFPTNFSDKLRARTIELFRGRLIFIIINIKWITLNLF